MLYAVFFAQIPAVAGAPPELKFFVTEIGCGIAGYRHGMDVGYAQRNNA